MRTVAPTSAAERDLREPLLAQARRHRLRRALPAGIGGLVLLVVSFVGFLAAEPGPTGAPVLALTQPVVAGHALVSGDLKVVTVSAPGVPTVSASALDQVLGRSVLVSLPAGSLLAAADTGGVNGGPPRGQAIVGAALKPGSYPAGIAAGSTVLVFAGPNAPITDATVYDSSPSADGSTQLVSLLVPVRDAAAVNAAASAGTVSLVWVTP